MMFLAASILLGLVAIYPYAVYPMLLRFFPRAKARQLDETAKPSFALFFAAYNEEQQLPRTLGWLEQLKALWPDLTIYAYNDCSSDRTRDLLDDASHFVHVIHGASRHGKPYGIRQLISNADADIGIFIDANIDVDVSSILNFPTYFCDLNIGTVGAKLSYKASGETNAKVGSAYWRLEERIKARETATGNTMGADGSMFATRLATYPDFPNDNADDFRVSMESLFHGQQCISASDIFVYEEQVRSLEDELKRKRRIACGAFAAHRHMYPKLRKMSGIDRFKYFSHRLLRWFGAVFIWLSAIAFLAHLIKNPNLATYLGVVALMIAVSMMMFARARVYAMQVANILAAIHAVQWGVFENLIGKKYQTWTPAPSRNDR